MWDFYPMPAVGTALTIGDAYKYEGVIFQVRQSHNRTPHDPRSVPALFTILQFGRDLHWIAGETVAKDSVRIYDTTFYKCLQTHTTQQGWEPPSTPSLWQNMTVSIYWTVGVAYKVNDLVIYQPNGFTYKCLQAHTSQAGWTPPAVPALWQKQ